MAIGLSNLKKGSPANKKVSQDPNQRQPIKLVLNSSYSRHLCYVTNKKIGSNSDVKRLLKVRATRTNQHDESNGNVLHDHLNGGLAGAAHQVQHRVIEKSTFKLLEKVTQRVGVDQTANIVVLASPDGQVAKVALSRMNQAFERRLEQIVGQELGKHAPSLASLTLSSPFGSGVPSHFVASLRGAAAHAQRLGEVLLRLARVSPALISQFYRCASVLLPALGAFFVVQTANKDYCRLRETRGKSRAVQFCFFTALALDAADAVAHVVIVACLLYEHYGFGLPLLCSHKLHVVETATLVVAAIAMVAAAAGEIILARVASGRISTAIPNDNAY